MGSDGIWDRIDNKDALKIMKSHICEGIKA
jgi:serine/threonine protein phosphatase PrpC